MIALPVMAQLHWDFESGKAEPFKSSGSVKFDRAGPRPPEFPDFAADNNALDLQSNGARLSLKDPGPNSPYDYQNGDAIGLEAWVNLFDFTASPMYIIGKGRTGAANFPSDNQNWALRVIVKNDRTHISFLFATPEPGEQHWHRWTSTATFSPFDGWHHVAVTYRFGEPKTIRGWIDGKPTDGSWDMGGATRDQPVVDDDEIRIGSSINGSLDEIRLHHVLLEDAEMASRFRRLGGPRVEKVNKAVMPEIELPENRVVITLGDGLTRHTAWPRDPGAVPKESTRWIGDDFLLPRIPARFDSWGIRDSWNTAVLLRMAGDMELAAGKNEFLIRARGLSRLWVNGELVAATKAGPSSSPDGEEPLRNLDAPPMPGLRVQAYRHQQAVGAIEISEAGSYRVVYEVVVGGRTQRIESGEVCVARKTGDSYEILGRNLPLTDAAVEPALAEIEASLSHFDDETRRAAANSQDAFWATRHQAAADWAQGNPPPAVPGPGNPIDAFIAAKIANARAESAKAGPAGVTFHGEILPILREACFRCHGEKDKGDLKLDSREAALDALVPGKPGESELIARLKTDDEEERMPPKGDGLTAAEIATLEAWIAAGAAWPAAPVTEAQVALAPLTTDHAFLRRVYLDTVGIPPSTEEARVFLANPDRAQLIDRLLADERSTDHWMGYWQDLLAENPTLINNSLNSTGPFRWFIRDALRDRKPVDRLVTELLMLRGNAAYGGSAGFGEAGENDAPFAAKAHIVASGFLGIELQCARCHDSPYHKTTQEDLYSLAAMFNRKPMKVPSTSRVPAGFFAKSKGRQALIKVSMDLSKPAKPIWPFAPVTGAIDGPEIAALMQKPSDTRERLATLITAPSNTRFARVFVNRVWKRLIGTGFVEPIHDWEGKSASHPELLDWLAHDFVNHGYDLQRLARQVLSSQTYQRQAVGKNQSAGPEQRYFNAPEPRRLSAEQVVDSLHACTGSPMDTEILSFVHDGRRALGKRQWLGKPTRAWMFASLNNERDRPSLSLPRAQAVVNVLQAFGWTGSRQRPIAQRETEANVLQPGILANGVLGTNLTRASHGSELAQLAVDAESAESLVDSLFLRILTRAPDREERLTFTRALEEGFAERVISTELGQKPEEPKLRLVHWFNHLRPESNNIQLEHDRRLRAGPPPDPRLQPAWREIYEDAIWSLINHREFVWMP
ncbi:MAG: cytochrome c553 [Rhodothermales bacterium]|jgi:cytochrome c553